MMLNRRNILAAAVALPMVNRTSIASAAAPAWPHPNVGVVLDVKGYDDRGDGRNGYTFRHIKHEVLAGMVFLNGKVIDPGRGYTRAEWEVVGEDISAFTGARMKSLGF